MGFGMRNETRGRRKIGFKVGVRVSVRVSVRVRIRERWKNALEVEITATVGLQMWRRA